MPTLLPTVSRVRRVQAQVTPLAVSCAAIGAAAAMLAAFVGWGCGDVPAAALILVLTGAAIEVLLAAARP